MKKIKKLAGTVFRGLSDRMSGRIRLGFDASGIDELWTLGDFKVVLPVEGMTIIKRTPWSREVVALSDSFLATDAVSMVVVSASACRADVGRAANSEFALNAEKALLCALGAMGDAGMLKGMLKSQEGFDEEWMGASVDPCPCMGIDAQCIGCRGSGQVHGNARINGRMFSGQVIAVLKRWRAEVHISPPPPPCVPQPFIFPGGFGLVMPMCEIEK